MGVLLDFLICDPQVDGKHCHNQTNLPFVIAGGWLANPFYESTNPLKIFSRGFKFFSFLKQGDDIPNKVATRDPNDYKIDKLSNTAAIWLILLIFLNNLPAAKHS